MTPPLSANAAHKSPYAACRYVCVVQHPTPMHLFPVVVSTRTVMLPQLPDTCGTNSKAFVSSRHSLKTETQTQGAGAREETPAKEFPLNSRRSQLFADRYQQGEGTVPTQWQEPHQPSSWHFQPRNQPQQQALSHQQAFQQQHQQQQEQQDQLYHSFQQYQFQHQRHSVLQQPSSLSLQRALMYPSSQGDTTGVSGAGAGGYEPARFATMNSQQDIAFQRLHHRRQQNEELSQRARDPFADTHPFLSSKVHGGAWGPGPRGSRVSQQQQQQYFGSGGNTMHGTHSPKRSKTTQQTPLTFALPQDQSSGQTR